MVRLYLVGLLLLLLVQQYCAHTGWHHNGLDWYIEQQGHESLKICLEIEYTTDEIHAPMLRSTFLRYCTAARTFSTVGGKTGAAGRVTVGSRGTGGSTTGRVATILNRNYNIRVSILKGGGLRWMGF